MIKQTLVLLCVLLSISNVYAEGDAYGIASSWIENTQECNQKFDITVWGYNITSPNTFDYTLEYYLVYCNKSNMENTIQLDSQSFSKSLPITPELLTSYEHFIPTHTLNGVIEEIESGDESPSNKTRYVKIVYAGTLTDNGGTDDNEDIEYVWFTGCYGSEGGYTTEGKVFHGFDMDSIAGEGGSGGIANSLGWGDMTAEGAEHKSVFEIFFYGLIPLLFILLVTKLMLRVNRG